MPASLVSDVTQSIEQKVRGYCTWCDRNAYRALHVDDVADKFDENPTTVNRHLGNAGVRGLHDVIACARLLYVAYRLDTTSASIKTISKTLSFESPQALDMFVKRSTGLTPSDLKNRGAVEHVRSVIVTRLRRD